MADMDKMVSRAERVASILGSVNQCIGESRAMDFVGNDDDILAVPYGLREAIAWTGLFMLQEMSAKSAASHHERLKQRHQDYKDSLPADHEHKKISFNKWKKLDRQQRGAAGKGLPKKGNVKKRAKETPEEFKARKAKKKAPSKKKASRSRGGGDAPPPPPPPPAAGAAQVAATDDDTYKSKKTGKKLPLAPALQRMAKRRREGKIGSGTEKETKTKGEIGKKVAALRKAGEKLKEIGAKARRADKKAPPGMPEGRRRPMAMPERGTIPSEFKAHQKRKDKSLAALEKARQQRSKGMKGTRDAEWQGPLRTGEQPPWKGRVERGLLSKAGHLARLRLMDPELRDTRHDAAKGYDPDELESRIRSRHGRGIERKIRADIADRIEKKIRREKPHLNDAAVADHVDNELKKRDKLIRKLVNSKVSKLVDKGMGRLKKHPTKKGYHLDADGREVHSSGKKANKNFANATTFGNSDTDALLHTDKSKEGARATADNDEFAITGDTKDDPRNKWYRVSNYASAMGSLRKAYGKSKKFRQKVIDKVKSQGFTDSEGHQINVKPTGGLHNERGACVGKKSGRLTKVGEAMKKTNPQEFYRLCKGAHGPSGNPDRNEYNRGFDPRHDDPAKLRKLHKAAEAGQKPEPHANIARHMAARGPRRKEFKSKIKRISKIAKRQD